MLKRPQTSAYSKNPVEKYIIRMAFDTDTTIIIDKNILWSHSQDIRSSFNNLKMYLEQFFDNKYTDYELQLYKENLNMLSLKLLPRTKEEMHYKKIFDTYYPYTSNVLDTYWYLLWKK